MNHLHLMGVAALATLLIACGGSPQQPLIERVTEAPPLGETVAGRAFDTTLESELDGETIAISFFEPTEITGGQTYPLIMNSHGFGGSRQKASSTDGLIKR
ncbi:MAG: hypothetical protein OXT49_02210, partial [Gammaproteobacteria bacterium]|nr:hypothetical protein [Gammaproteobacteria bacterium]